ncbi:MAG: lipopolysaccharide heptosyltransferase II, partial [Ktedonobacterales bacterium]
MTDGRQLPILPAKREVTDRQQQFAFEEGYETRPPVEARATTFVGRRVKRLAQALLRAGFGALGALLRDWHDPLPPLYPGDARIRRILVVRVDLLGDTVLSTPAVRALRRAYPRATIDMLTLASSAAILAGDPDISRVIAFNPHVWRNPANWRRLRTWREALAFLHTARSPRYDLAVSVSGDIGSIVTRLTGARRRVGYAREAYRNFLTDPVPGGRYRIHQHEAQYVLRLAEAAGGIVEPGDEWPRLHVIPAARERAQVLLHEGRLTTGAQGPVIALHAGARNGQAKRWPARHWSTLIDRLVSELDALVVLTGAPNEASLADEITAHALQPALNLCGRTTLPELTALLSACDLVVSGDSGPMHIACAVRTPVVVLHGPTDPAISGPTDPDAIIVRHALWCSPC